LNSQIGAWIHHGEHQAFNCQGWIGFLADQLNGFIELSQTF